MRYYELLYIVNPNLETDRVNNIIDEIGKEISKYKVSIINHHVWGKKRLAYPIKNNKYGIYLLLQFSSEKFDFLVELERFLILDKSVIRHQLVRLDEEPAKVENIEPLVEDVDKTESESTGNQEDGSTENLTDKTEADKEVVEKVEITEEVKKEEKEEEKEVEKIDDIPEEPKNDKEIKAEKKEDDK